MPFYIIKTKPDLLQTFCEKISVKGAIDERNIAPFQVGDGLNISILRNQYRTICRPWRRC